jgi:prepilin-type N-terminal cleavage/methylation domain-containing protein
MTLLRYPVCKTSHRRAQPSLARLVRPAFTLIELLIVIAIISIIAGMIFPSIRAVNRIKRVALARAEMNQVQSCIEAYKSRLGHYPPDNRSSSRNEPVPGLNQLYYELAGTLYSDGRFTVKDNTAETLSSAMIVTIFGTGVSGFVNTERGNSDEGRSALQLLKGFRPGQIASISMTNPATGLTSQGHVLVCTVPGPDPNVPALNNGSPPLNPWRYVSSSPTNNPNSYDLWTDLTINGKVLRVCNWSNKPITVP